MASNPYGGSIGYNIWNEEGDNGGKTHNLGMVGSPNSTDNAAAAEVRGNTYVSLDGSVDTDYYQGTASWWRPGTDQSPISGGIGVSLNVAPNHLAGVVVVVYDAFGNFVKSGVDFVFSDGAREAMGEDLFQQLEGLDADFVTGANQVGPKDDMTWQFPMVVGNSANTFVVGIAGFDIDMSSGQLGNLHYTMDMAFA